MSQSQTFFPTDPKERSDKIKTYSRDLEEVKNAWGMTVNTGTPFWDDEEEEEEEEEEDPQDRQAAVKNHEDSLAKREEFLDALHNEFNDFQDFPDLKIDLEELLEIDYKQLPKDFLDEVSDKSPSPETIMTKADRVMTKITTPPVAPATASAAKKEKPGDKAKVFGHNGIEPGKWWRYQADARNAGAHGHGEVAITGDAVEGKGAYSIVVNNKYKFDKDTGETLKYGDHVKKPLGALAFNIAPEGKLVRVIRGNGGRHVKKAKYETLKGFRYDGLYKVVSKAKMKKKVKVKRDGTGGGTKEYTQYTLKRVSEEEGQKVSLEECIRRGKKEMDQYRNDHPGDKW